MCGLHFAINSDTYTNNLDKFLKDSFYANQVRGIDSSGMFQVMPNGSTQVIKKAVNASDFLEYSNVNTMLTDANRARATVCHVRAATFGSVIDANAHPFTVHREDKTKLIGVHNGTIDGWRSNTGADDHDVDSAWLFSKLAEDGAEAFKGFPGAFALIWYDTRHPDHVFVARNDKRELFYAFTADKKALIGASELGMLGWLADRNKLKLAKDEKGYSHFYFDAGKIYKINTKNVMDMKIFDYSTYDADAKLYKKPEPVTSMVSTMPTQTYHYPSQHSSMLYDDDGYYYSAHEKRRGSSNDDWKVVAQERVLDKIKDILRLARRDLDKAAVDSTANPIDPMEIELHDDYDDDHIVSQDLEAGVKTALAIIGGDKQVFVSDPNTRKAGAKEIATAKSSGMFGLLVNFSGVFFDDETLETYGEFDIIEDGKKNTYDAVVRGWGKRQADKVIFSKGLEMVVIGVTETRPPSVPFIVLTELETKAAAMDNEQHARRYH